MRPSDPAPTPVHSTGQPETKAVACIHMPQAALLWSPGGADHEARLARAAATGNGRAFATLYDRYEGRVFNLALRITGSEAAAARVTSEAFLEALRALAHVKDGEPFGSCLLTAARNAGEDLAGPPPAAQEEPAADPDDDDPDFEAWQQRLRDSSLRLPVHEREVLALTALDRLGYAETAAIVDADADSVAALLAGARLALHDELFGTSLATAPPAPEDCAQALPLIAMRDDGALDDEDDFAWLVDHLAHCGDCRVRLDAIEEASAAYGEWQPAAPPPGLLREVMAAAAGLVQADWDELIEEREARRSQGRARSGTLEALAATAPLPALRPALSGAGGAATEALGSLRTAASGLASDAWRRRPDRSRLATTALLAVALVGLAAIAAGATLVLQGDDERPPTAPPIAPADSAAAPQSGRTFPTGPEPRPTERTARTEAPTPRRKKRSREVVVTQVPQVETPRPTPKRRSVPQAVAVPVPKPKPTPPPAQTTPELPQFKPAQ